MTSPSTTKSQPFTAASFLAALAGAGGGLLSFFVGEVIGNLFGFDGTTSDIASLFIGSACWSGAIGLTIGLAILIYDNFSSLRGVWHRDVPLAFPLFFVVSFCGGIAGQLAYSLSANPLTRGIGWALMGVSVGIGVGILRRDMIQASRGAIGGAIGGFIGGFIFDALFLLSQAGNGSFSRLIGQLIMGALIALMMRVVQDALKDAWLLGISSGPYEGKEYPLNTASVSVGREDSNAIALYRETQIPARLGALVYQNSTWFWQGEAVQINGVPQTNAALNPGDTLTMGSTRFRFQSKSVKGPATGFTPPDQQHYTPAHTPAPYAAGMPSAPTSQSPTSPLPTPHSPTSQSPTPFSPTVPSTVPARPLPPPSFNLMALNGQLLKVPDLSGPVNIGRAPANQLVLADPGVSSSHARFQVSGGTLSVTDLGSTNGTFVNGSKLTPNAPQTVRIGDRVRFGTLEYTLRAA